MTDVSTQLELIRQRMAIAIRKAKRASNSVRLVGVSKMHSVEMIEAAIAAGLTCFGENRILESFQKFTILRQRNKNLELHYIGQLQTNKALDAVSFFDVIETIDRTKLAIALSKAVQKIGRCPKLFVEVNLGNEPYKGGVRAENLPFLLKECDKVFDLPITGLMCIPPQKNEPTPYFQHLKKLVDDHGLKELSMGMSYDFEQAIACGATEIRIGTALFDPHLLGTALYLQT